MITITNCPLCNSLLIEEPHRKFCKNELTVNNTFNTFYHYNLLDSDMYHGMSELFIIDNYVVVNYNIFTGDKYFTVREVIENKTSKFEGCMKCDKIAFTKFLKLKSFW